MSSRNATHTENIMFALLSKCIGCNSRRHVEATSVHTTKPASPPVIVLHSVVPFRARRQDRRPLSQAPRRARSSPSTLPLASSARFPQWSGHNGTHVWKSRLSKDTAARSTSTGFDLRPTKVLGQTKEKDKKKKQRVAL